MSPLRYFVGISPRVDVANSGEVREAIDQNWAIFLANFGVAVQPLSLHNETLLHQLSELPISGLIFSGGNDISVLPGAENASLTRDQAEMTMMNWAVEKNIPVLGVCRGAQFINIHFGGALSPVEGHVATRHLVHCNDTQIEVNSYHNWGIGPQELAASLVQTAVDEDGCIEAFAHETRPIWGMMWHPERDPINQQNEATSQLAFTPFLNTVRRQS